MRRMLVFDRNDGFLFELSERDVLSAVHTREINGEDSLDIVTSRPLGQGWRILHQDGLGKWHEHVVTAPDELHDSGLHAQGSYHAVWSAQHDLSAVRAEDVEVGGETPASATDAMAHALDGTVRWSVGESSSVQSTATIEMFDKSAWERVGQVVDAYGCEVESSIVVGRSKVLARHVDVKPTLGSSWAVRRFDWGRDLTSIRRRPQEGPLCCRIIPVGKGSDVGIYDINENYQHYDENGDLVRDQTAFLEDREAALAYRLSDGAGHYDYPTARVSFDIDDDRELLAYATEHLTDYTRPVPTYEATVAQYAEAGMDVKGVGLGDVVRIVDRGFNEDAPLRLEARVVKVVENLKRPADTELTVGQIGGDVSQSWKKLDAALGIVGSRIDKTNAEMAEISRSTAQYLDNLLDHLNAQINANGGYTYITDRYGMRTYDRAVSDPLVGAEATKVVEIKGGTIRIANSKTNGDWNWRTVFEGGFIAVDVLTANNVVAGKIQDAQDKLSPGTGNYWDLDNSVLNVQKGSILANLITAGKIQSANGKVYFDLDNNELVCDKMTSTDNTTFVTIDLGTFNTSGVNYEYMARVYRTTLGTVTYNNCLALIPPASTGGQASIRNYSGNLAVSSNGTTTVYGTTVFLRAPDDTLVEVYNTSGSRNILLQAGTTKFVSTVTVNGSFTVSGGSKNRLVETDGYGGRLLYSYETAAPMFGDVGSGVIGEDGLCYVDIDAVFAETARVDFAYQVFLQKCGQGDLWVAEKHPTHFVVEGTPGLAFDWELKARQVELETERLEEFGTRMEERAEQERQPSAESPESAYSDYVTEMEQLYEQETAA